MISSSSTLAFNCFIRFIALILQFIIITHSLLFYIAPLTGNFDVFFCMDTIDERRSYWAKYAFLLKKYYRFVACFMSKK